MNRRLDVHLWEEPVFEERDAPTLLSSVGKGQVRVLTPLLPHGLSGVDSAATQRVLLDQYLAAQGIRNLAAWYYTPMALKFSDHLEPIFTVYDCMDELSGFNGAPPELVEMEKNLFARADVVFVGGASLYASKRTQHPRIGFFGVIDERLDRALLSKLAEQHANWHFVLIGPIVKIRQEDLPRGVNLYYLGQKDYAELPMYLGHWDVAILPFAQNASTRFISPTKTPEYLAAGKPVVSTPIRDVVQPYGEMGLVRIGADAKEFGDAIETSLESGDAQWLARVDDFLSGISWDKTFEGMWKQIQQCKPLDAASSALKIQ